MTRLVVVVDWVIFFFIFPVLEFFPFFFVLFSFLFAGNFFKIIFAWLFSKIVFPYTSRAQVVRVCVCESVTCVVCVLFRVVCSNGKSTMMLLDIQWTNFTYSFFDL